LKTYSTKLSQESNVMSRISVSIGIPFLNAAPMLADAVRSVFAQSHDDWELLLVDDGSTDGSLAIAEAIDDPRVRCLSDGVNRGLVYRLNQIAELANGRYLARMDADDLMHPQRLERQVRFLDANADVDIVDTATYTVDHDLTPLGVRGDGPMATAPETVLRQGLCIHPTVMGRAEWFRQHPYDAAYVRAEDRELWCRTIASSRFARLPEPLFFYREALTGNLKNYLKSAATVRQILRTYGPPLVGSWRTSLLVAQSHLRDIAYSCFTKFGQQGRLIGKRNRPLQPAEARIARDILTAIRRTRLPGFCTAAACAEVLT
jgi:glycosyltransferase involved in cell wall biosynthesis